jgi:hypothetical protein
MSTERYRFFEPHWTGGHAIVHITREQILEYYRTQRPVRTIVLKDEESIIDDFIICNWAERVDKEKGS